MQNKQFLVNNQQNTLSPSSPNSYNNSYQNPSGTSSIGSPQLTTTNAQQPLQATSTPNPTPTATNSLNTNTGTPTANSGGISGSDYQGGWSVPTVDDEINKITGSDSLTMQQARQQGLRSAGARGLLNSSIAGQSAEQAAIQAAAPIAQQNVTNQLQQQQFAQGITANTHGQYMQSVNEMQNQALISINEIETSTNISQAEKDKMIANTIARRDEDMKFLQKYYSMMPTWSGNWVNFPVMPEAPGVK